jgi:hypothetical protein
MARRRGLRSTLKRGEDVASMRWRIAIVAVRRVGREERVVMR